MATNSRVSIFTNIPFLSILAAAGLTIEATVLVVTGHMDDRLFGAFVVQSLPILIASFTSERTARDVRNGVLTDKVVQGTHTALDESGVSEAAAVSSALVPAHADAMSRLVNALDNHEIRISTNETINRNGDTTP